MSRVQIATVSDDYGLFNEGQNDDNVSDHIPLPVFDSPYVITSQPRMDLNAVHRSALPIDTTNWTSTPRSLLNPECGSQFLSGVKQLQIQRTVDLITLMGDMTNGGHYKYRVKVPRAETLFLVREHSSDSRIIGSSRGFIVQLEDASGQVAFTLMKDRSWGCVPGLLHKMDVHGNDFMGSIEQDFTIFAPRFTIYDDNRRPLCLIYSPHTFCVCSYTEERFQISSMDGCRPLASIILQWDNQSTEYLVTLTFPLNMDAKLKCLLLGAAFLMESLYFERVTKSPVR